MAAIDVSLVGAEDKIGTIGTDGRVFDFEVAGSEQGCCAAGGGDGIEMLPAVEFGWEDDVVAGCPEQLLVCCERMKDAALSFGCVPDFVAGSGCGICDIDRPGLTGAMGSGTASSAAGGADEGNLAAIGRPLGVAIGQGGWVNVGNGLAGDGVDADEAMITAVAGEGDVPSIGRP